MATAENTNNTEVADQSVSEAIQDSVELLDQVSDYGYVIMDSLYLIIGGMLTIFAIHFLISRLVYPHLKNLRILKVLIGTLYVLILVVAVLVVLKQLGFDVSVISRISILTVLIAAVGLFFLLPFLPRLPFKVGHLVKLSGELGVVDSITTYHTMLRSLDGNIIFIPNALLMAGKIINYHDTPERRITLDVEAGFDCDLDLLKAQMATIMQSDERVLDAPTKPMVVVTRVDASGAKVCGFCWVENKHWFAACSDMWIALLDAIQADDKLSLSRPERDVYLVGEKSD